jgi:uncharacterized protein
MSAVDEGRRRTDDASAATPESSTRPIVDRLGGLAALPLIGLVRFYQLFISPLTPPTCRYYPSCSTYALTALRRFGPIKGTWLAVRRVLRCHPWAPGGVDHVPERPGRGRASSQTERRTAEPDTRPSAPHLPPAAHPRASHTPRDKGLS